MITLTIDEATLNATRAALDERVKRLEHEIERYAGRVTRDYPKANESDQRALVWNIAALHETRMAQEFYAEITFEDHPEDATWTNREGMPEFTGIFR